MNTTLFLTIESLTCGACGVCFGLESSYHTRVKESQATFHCPNGHIISYTGKRPSVLRAEQAEKEAKQARADATFYRERSESAQREANLQKHRARGLKAAQTRMKKRVANGVCPCCTRSFENLQRHIATKHPKYGKESVPAAPPNTTERAEG